MQTYIFIAGCFATLAILIVLGVRTKRSGEWHPADSFRHPFSMTRYVNGEWQYRQMTDAEKTDLDSNVAI